jgi:hypothetical protein
MLATVDSRGGHHRVPCPPSTNAWSLTEIEFMAMNVRIGRSEHARHADHALAREPRSR